MLLIGTSIIAISYKRYEAINIQKHIQMANGMTELMIRELNTDHIDDYIKENYSSPEYNAILKTYYLLKDSYPDVTYVYVYKLYKDESGAIKATVIIDLDEEYTTDVPKESIDWIGDTYDVDKAFINDLDDKILKGQSVWHIVDAQAGEGEIGKRLLSYNKPIMDKDGNYVASACIDFSVDALYNKGLDFIAELLIVITIIGVVVVLALKIRLNKILLDPVHKLTLVIESFKYGDDTDKFKNIEKLENLNIRTNNEIDALYNALLVSVKESAYYMQHLNQTRHELEEVTEIVSKDALTRVGSKSAYQTYIEKLEKDLAEGKTDYAVVMADINNLKYINDTFGHDRGDEYIKACVKEICVQYNHAPVFRIGGDEFVIILSGESYKHRASLLSEIQIKFDDYFKDSARPEYERYSMSLGMAEFNPDTDRSYADMFVRADQIMYKNKTNFKQIYGSYR